MRAFFAMRAGFTRGPASDTQTKEFHMKRFLALIAFLGLSGFVLILVVEVPSPDLIVVALLTVGLVAYDFIVSSDSSRR